MKLIPWRRNSAEFGLGRQLDHFCNELFPRHGLWNHGFWPDGGGSDRQVFGPVVDVRETDTDFLVEAELPGVDPKEVTVSFEDGVLRLQGERKLEENKETKNVHRSERLYGAFERRIGLTEGVNPEDIEATYMNGILTVRIGKREEARPRTIPVTVKE